MFNRFVYTVSPYSTDRTFWILLSKSGNIRTIKEQLAPGHYFTFYQGKFENENINDSLHLRFVEHCQIQWESNSSLITFVSSATPSLSKSFDLEALFVAGAVFQS